MWGSLGLAPIKKPLFAPHAPHVHCGPIQGSAFMKHVQLTLWKVQGVGVHVHSTSHLDYGLIWLYTRVLGVRIWDLCPYPLESASCITTRGTWCTFQSWAWVSDVKCCVDHCSLQSYLAKQALSPSAWRHEYSDCIIIIVCMTRLAVTKPPRDYEAL